MAYRFFSVLGAGLLFGCGSGGGGFADANGDPTPTPTPRADGGGAQPASDAGTLPPGADTEFLGVWDIQGKDDRGDYKGQIEFVNTGTFIRFIRIARYTSVKVEGGRDLVWVWDGIAEGLRTNLRTEVTLLSRDFIAQRGSLTRAANVPHVVVKGAFRAGSSSDLVATFSGNGIAITDTLSGRRASANTPIFEGIKRSILPAHDPPGTATRAALFSSFSDYHALPVVAPYTGRPEFQAAVHGHILDTTDFTYYRQNPNAVRVINKVVDDISLLETRVRADAFRYTLRQKAQFWDQEQPQKFIQAGMVVDSRNGSSLRTSGDAALWTGTWIGSQAFRYLVTGEAVALENVAKGTDAILTLQEITGDWKQFARGLRPHTGPTQPPWHQGTGPFASLDWQEGGNNDMLKGLVYTYVMADKVLCGSPAYAPLCARIRTNAKHMADDLDIKTRVGTAVGVSHNGADNHWVAATVLDGSLEGISYRVKAEGYFAVMKPVEEISDANNYSNGIADWSGTHLAAVGAMARWLMADKVPLQNAKNRIIGAVRDQYADLSRQRLVMWHLVGGAIIPGGLSAPSREDLLWRLREVPYPKMSRAVDHRLQDDFCMSPYPKLPWKNDWMQYPTRDRTQPVNSYPLFEDPSDTYLWKTAFDYTSHHDEGTEHPGTDFLHAYWMGRYFNIISASE